MEAQLGEYRRAQKARFERQRAQRKVEAAASGATGGKEIPDEVAGVADTLEALELGRETAPSAKVLKENARGGVNAVGIDQAVSVQGGKSGLGGSGHRKRNRQVSEELDRGDKMMDDRFQKKARLAQQGKADNHQTTVVDSTTHQDDPSKSRLLFWNVDGLCEDFLKIRTRALIAAIKEIRPGAVFLQEVVISSLSAIRAALSDKYSIFDPSECEKSPCGKTSSTSSPSGLPPYFCVCMIDKSIWKPIGIPQVVWFPTSQMGRHMIVLRVASIQFPDEELIFITSHLESCKESAEERGRQLSSAFTVMNLLMHPELCEDCDIPGASKTNPASIFFGGDLNIRDSELSKIDVPDGISDVWQMMGSPAESKYTWDTLKNTNVKLQGNYKPRLRFDRVFYVASVDRDDSPSSPSGSADGESICAVTLEESVAGGIATSDKQRWQPCDFELVGTDPLESCEMFVSDHFGMSVGLRRSASQPENGLPEKRPRSRKAGVGKEMPQKRRAKSSR